MAKRRPAHSPPPHPQPTAPALPPLKRSFRFVEGGYEPTTPGYIGGRVSTAGRSGGLRLAVAGRRGTYCVSTVYVASVPAPAGLKATTDSAFVAEVEAADKPFMALFTNPDANGMVDVHQVVVEAVLAPSGGSVAIHSHGSTDA